MGKVPIIKAEQITVDNYLLMLYISLSLKGM